MKILAIRGCNLASLAGEFEIDLGRAPFSDAGVFAIVGNTGAGKSTLLDALCVALFDRTPRLTNHSRVTVGRDSDDPCALGAHDARTLLRRGAAAGYAEVDFEDGAARRYRARWSVRRARNQTDGTLQDQTLSLIALDNQERLGGTKTETLKAIASRLGLTFDQFRRSALLAQGEFAAFLRADGKDRSELLERMTGTEIYSRLSVAAHLRAALAEQRLRDTRAAALAIPILDDAARAVIEADLAIADQAKRAARLRLDAAEAAARWLAEATVRQRGVEAALAEHAAAVAAAADAEPVRTELALRQRAARLRGPLETVMRLDGEVTLARRDADALDASGRELAATSEGLRARRIEVDQLLTPIRAARIAAGWMEARAAAGDDGTGAELRDSLTRSRAALDDAAWLVARAALSSPIAGWTAIEERFIEHATLGAALTSIERAIAVHDDERRALSSSRTLVEADHKTALAAVADARRGLQAFHQRRGPTLDAARKREDEARKQVTDAEQLVAIAASAAAAVEECKTLQQALDELAAAARRDEARSADLAAAGERACVLRDERARALVELRRAAGYMHARTELRDGEPCPLCGALEHPWRDRGALDDVIASARAKLDETASELSAIAGESAELALRAEHRDRERAARQARRANLDEILAAMTSEWRSRLVALGELVLDADPTAGSAAQLAADRVATAQRQLDAARDVRHQTEAAAKAAADTQAAMQLAQANVDQLAGRLRDLDRSLAEHDGSVQRLRGERAGRLERLGPLAQQLIEAHDRWRAIDAVASAHAGTRLDGREPMSHVGHAGAGLVGRDRRIIDGAAAAHVGTRVDDHEPTSHVEHDVGPGARPDGRETSHVGHDPDRVDASCRRAVPALRRSPSALADARRWMAALVESWLAAARRVAEAEALLAGATHGLDRDMVVLEQTATEQRARLGETRRRIAELEDALLDADRQLDATCAQTGFARSELAALAVALGGQRQDREYQNALHSALADDRRTEQLTTQLGALDAAVLRTRAIADERRQLAAEHAASRPEELGDADALDALAAAVTEAERRAAETAAALAADTDARRRREAAFGALAEDERKAEIDRVLGEVIGSHDGKLFRSFAQSLTLDGLLAITNAHLDELAPRFQLERIPRHDLEIQVIDRDLGDDVRSVQSLSGGEAFLVSLALALGLSSMSAHDVRVRTLLIDEGFGTLDPTTLDGALAVLDRLQATGRQIGVISHVPALIERVGAHVRVVQRGVGASQVVIS